MRMATIWSEMEVAEPEISEDFSGLAIIIQCEHPPPRRLVHPSDLILTKLVFK